MEDKKTYIGKTKNGFEVYVDMHDSHAATHLADTPELFSLVGEALSMVEPTEERKRYEIDLGRVVGKRDLVETTESDNIVYAKRLNRGTYTRFVKNKTPMETTKVTLDLEKNDETYDLFTAYIGVITPPFPGDEFETKESRAFWSTHALVWGTQGIILGTETTGCPW